MTQTPGSDSDTRAIEARIARALSTLALDPNALDADIPPPAYIRRHLAEHAAAGGCLNERVIPPELLPFIDINRLREQAARPVLGSASRATPLDGPASDRAVSWPVLLKLVRQASHAWEWDHPYQNAAALQFWAAAGQIRLSGLDELSFWRVLWAKSPGPSEIIGQVKSVVTCVTTTGVPDKGYLAVTGSRDGTLSIWNLTSGSVISAAPRRAAAIRAVAIVNRPPGVPQAISGSADGTVRLWGSLDGQSRNPDLLKERRGGAGITAIMTASINGEPIALFARQDGTLHIWDLNQDELHTWWASRGDYVTGIATAALSGGQQAAVIVRLDGTLQLWELTGARTNPRQMTRPVPGHDEAIQGVATAELPSGRVIAVTGGDDGSMRIWDLQPLLRAGEPVTCHQGGAVSGVAICALPDRVYAVTAGRDQSLRVWSLPEGAPVGDPLEGHSLEVTAIAGFTLPGTRATVISAGSDRSLRIWDLAPALASAQPIAANDQVTASLAGLPPGQQPAAVSAAVRDDLQTWSLDDGQQLGHPLRFDVRGVIAVATGRLSNGNEVVVTGCEHPSGPHAISDSHPDADDHSNPGRTAPISLVVPPHRSLAVTSHDDGRLRLWDLAGLSPLGSLSGHAGPVLALAAAGSADRAVLISGGSDRTVRVWDLPELASAEEPARTGEVRRDRQLLRSDGSAAHDGPVTVLAATQWNGRHIAVSGSNTTVQVWDLNTSKLDRPPFDPLTHPVTALAATDAGGDLLGVLGSEQDGTVHVWNLGTGTKLWTLCGHERPVTAIATGAFRDGTAVAFTASSDHTVRSWNLGEGTQIGDALPLPAVPRALAAFCHPAGPGVIVGGSNVLTAVQLWRR